jgi:hypothetical protein
MARLLSGIVQLRQQFLRSVRIDADYGRSDALDGFVLQPSSRTAIETLARHINETHQRAFTWTGPYGGGKSSLALALSSLVSPEKRIQESAKVVLGLRRGDPILRAFNASPNDGWAVLPIVGKRSQIENEVAMAIDRLPHRRKRTTHGRERDVIAELTALAESPGRRGVLIVIDELGKFLEFSAQTEGDIYFYQQLAEAACRTRGKLVVVGILHQAFEQYATRLGRDARDEWAKVQGRFVDISLAAGSDEVIDLIGKAIDSKNVPHSETRYIAETIARAIGERRPSLCKDLNIRLDHCWPLHPITAVLLGPSSRRRFGQNERSIFGFLNSVEPMGFREFLESHIAEAFSYYWPWQFWDYMRANLEPAILASPDGHRWALGVEAVERTESKGDATHLDLVKTIAVIDLFRNGSGLAADNSVLAACFPGEPQTKISEALEDLAKWSIIVYRRHLTAWGIYAGSDFDIEAATARARSEIDADELQMVEGLRDLTPVLAKRTYQETGAMRFLQRSIVRSDSIEEYLTIRKVPPGSCGEFILMIPSRGTTLRSSHLLARKLASLNGEKGIVIGVPKEANRIAEDARELSALERVYITRTELESDRVAAREIDARIVALKSEVEDLLRDSFSTARWYWQSGGTETIESKSLSMMASSVAEARYPNAPILLSELINRDSPSSNSVKARRDLMHRMLHRAGETNLGYEGYPADAGMYYSIIKRTGLHRQGEDGNWAFAVPSASGLGRSMKAVWNAADRLLLHKGGACRLSDLYAAWSAPPFGVKAGVLPLLALAYFLANSRSIALYHEEVFIPHLTEVHVDEWLQDSFRITWKYFAIDSIQQEMISGLSKSLSKLLGSKVTKEPLELARALVSLVVNLPEWTKRTSQLSPRSKDVRQALLKATDPHRVLFMDLPAMLEEAGGPSIVKSVSKCIAELNDAFPRMLRTVETKVFQVLDHKGSIDELRHRGSTVTGISGDFRLDAFSLRLANYQGTLDDVESLVSLAVNKPVRDWTDRDIELAFVQLGTWAFEFRKVETFAPLRDRPATRRAFAVVFGLGDGNATTSRSFDIASSDIHTVKRLADEIRSKSDGIVLDVFLAALAEAGAQAARRDGRA